MTTPRGWRRLSPRSLAGQMALLVAIALFLAQAINFGLLLRERRQVRFEQFTAPAITRLTDAAERLSHDRPLADGEGPGGRRGGRVILLPASPIAPDLPRVPEMEDGVRTAIKDAGLGAGRIVSGVRGIDPNDPHLRDMEPGRRQRLLRFGAELVVAVEQPGKGWLVLRAPWQQGDGPLFWRLIAQTLILYGAVLMAVLFVGRRIARPLRALAKSAASFTPGDGVPPLPQSGPSDVRVVIAAFNDLRTRVTGMLDEKDRMLGAIGHDLRTPLAALRVRIESVEDEADHDRMADIIDEMSRTLDDILSLARIGKPSEAPTETDLAALVDAVVEDFRDLGADVTAEETPRIRMTVRPGLMRRAVRNLIENAVKYAGAAEVRIVDGAHEVCIDICDRGPGIPQDRLDDVFDPFTRLENSRNRDTGGIGLGLALTRAIVRDARGEVRLANRDGGGLVATIVLPRGQ